MLMMLPCMVRVRGTEKLATSKGEMLRRVAARRSLLLGSSQKGCLRVSDGRV